MDTNNDSPPLEKAKVMEAVLKLSVLSYLTIEHISKNGCFSVLLVLFLILVINTIEKTILYCLFRIQHLCRHRTLNLIKSLKSLRSSSRLKHIWLVYMQVKTDPKVFHNKYTWMVFLQVMDDATNVQEELSLSSKSPKFQICKSLVPPSSSWWPSKRPPPLQIQIQV